MKPIIDKQRFTPEMPAWHRINDHESPLRMFTRFRTASCYMASCACARTADSETRYFRPFLQQCRSARLIPRTAYFIAYQDAGVG